MSMQILDEIPATDEKLVTILGVTLKKLVDKEQFKSAANVSIRCF